MSKLQDDYDEAHRQVMYWHEKREKLGKRLQKQREKKGERIVADIKNHQELVKLFFD